MTELEEIHDLKSQIQLLEVQLKSSKQDVEQLKFELKAADTDYQEKIKQLENTIAYYINEQLKTENNVR